MKNNKGQALVEFILITPILIFILLAIVDIGNIVINKYKLENHLDTIVDLYQNSNSSLSNYISKNKLDVTYETDNKYITIIIKDSLTVKTPFLNNIIGKNYIIETKRTIYNE